MKEKNLIRLVTFAPIIIIPAIAILISIISIEHNNEVLTQSIQNVRERFISEEKKAIISKINMAIKLIEYQRSTIEKELQSKVKIRVDNAYLIAQNIYNQNKDTKSESEIKKMIIDALRPMTWNNGESFIFILDKEGKFALAPEYLRSMENKSMLDFKDATQRFVIREEIDLVNSQGEGFLWDTFLRKGYDVDVQFKQLAYVKDMGHFNWYMGSTQYLDTAAKAIESTTIDILRNINEDETQYFFIIDKKGNDLLHPHNPEYEGENILDVGTQEIKEIISNLLDNADKNSSEFTSYVWKNPINSKIEAKLSYVKLIPNTEWMIGTGLYIQDIDAISEAKKAELVLLHQTKTEQLIFFSVLFSLLSIVASFFVSMGIKRNFEKLHTDIKQSNKELHELNTSLEERINERTVELKTAHDAMSKIAMTDSLTGIYNRYAFLTVMEAQQNKMNRDKSCFSLIMLDLDNFKRVNDSYGHDVGDKVLIEVVQNAATCLRKNDVFGRVGGEEFMVMLPDTTLEAAKDIAERIRSFIASQNIEPVGIVTVSMGVVQCEEDEELQEVIKRSDIALYKAKELGRNRVEIG